ncbi:hypothetical protein Y032_0325g2542 [Ancylostoma ceylanicum]|uniref:Uncharacterized protein n=1 Tax=Ancylostoma ceylanicum TaxID=53326 RepID=A0A016S145_9BILA|nr:hypothetical protein Y032_0325g2542 [Ancylostoma ceylanicum]
MYVDGDFYVAAEPRFGLPVVVDDQLLFGLIAKDLCRDTREQAEELRCHLTREGYLISIAFCSGVYIALRSSQR